MIRTLIIFAISLSLNMSQANELVSTINSLQNSILNEVQETGAGRKYWHMPPHYGLRVFSEYLLLSSWLKHDQPKFDKQKFKQELLRQQLADGSWIDVPDFNRTSGDIDPTVLNYLALKVLGVPTNHPQMYKARTFIIDSG